MKQTSIIRISFLICAALAVIAFWSGFYFGENSGKPQQQIMTASDKDFSASDAADNTDAQLSASQESPYTDEQTVESMQGLEAEKYYIKPAGEYLAVYHTDTDTMYFETDLKLSDLPEDVQTEAESGISFSSLEDLYSFLENYSS